MIPEDSVFVKNELQRLIDGLGGKVKIFIVRGNHDGTVENSVLDYVKHPLAEYFVVVGEKSLIGEPEVYDDGVVAVQGLGYTPYPTAKLEQIHDQLRDQFIASKAKYKFLLVHSFFEYQSGLQPQVPKHQILFSIALMDIGFNFLICGHQHRATPLEKIGNFYVLTPGALEAVELSDETVHGYHILTLDGEPEAQFIPIKPLQVLKNVQITNPQKQSEKWYAEEAVECAQAMVKAHKSMPLILRLILSGVVDGDKYTVEEEVTTKINLIKVENPNLIYFEVKNDLVMVSAPLELALIETSETVYPKIFEILDENKRVKAVEIAEEVESQLEETASSITGLLTDFNRRKIIDKWKKLIGGEDNCQQ